MELYLIRHADAVDEASSDFARVLTDKGRRQAAKMGEWLKGQKALPLFIVTSPYPRAMETADIVGKALGKETTVRTDQRLASGMTTDVGSQIIHELGNADRRLCLVGHSPDLDRLAAHLVGAKAGGLAFAKGAIAMFDTDRAGFGGSTLKWLITPKLL